MRSDRKFPVYGYIGIVLIIIFWYLNWHLTGLRTHWGFFPLWLGYCLTIDAIVFYREGTSLITRNLVAYIFLFVISAPLWWLFEALNERAQYWHYTQREMFTDLEYFLLATISFSTVLPAVLGTTELISSLRKKKASKRWINLGGR